MRSVSPAVRLIAAPRVDRDPGVPSWRSCSQPSPARPTPPRTHVPGNDLGCRLPVASQPVAMSVNNRSGWTMVRDEQVARRVDAVMTADPAGSAAQDDVLVSRG